MNEENYTFSQKTMDDYCSQTGSYLDDEVTIIIHDSDLKTRKKALETVYSVEQKESETPAPKELSQFIYMDVGRWGGDEPNNGAWTRQRTFGLVCGSGAILCEYPYPKIYGDPNLENISQDIKDNKDIQKMIPLLKKLSESNSLGSVKVLKALVCTDEKTAESSSNDIFVFLGDIHAPVVNIHDRTYLQKPPIDKSKVFSRERINPRIFEKEVTENFDNFTKRYQEISLESEAKDTESILQVLKKCLEQLLDSQRVKKWDEVKIPCIEADEWFSHYHEADIFQNAGSDLESFLTLLLESQKMGSTPQVQLIQLGDLFDFWIGLYWAFDDNIQPSSVLLQQKGNDSPVQSFLDFWRNETLNETSVSPAIYSLLTQTKTLKPVFVYGNHDNYRVTSAWKHETSPKNFITPEIWAEHGHQSDTCNQDSFAIFGWTCAQFGFFCPKLRDYEDTLRDLVTSVEKKINPSTPCQRLIHIRHAACLSQQWNKRIYIMGHTHEPLLKKVHIVEQY